MAIEWETLVIEMTLLAGIILGSVFFERWIHERVQRKEEAKTRQKILGFVANDLQKKLGSLDKMLKEDFHEPFFTDTWDTIVHTGKATLFSFEEFESLQRAYSLMKHYNSELLLVDGKPAKSNYLDGKYLNKLLFNIKQSIILARGLTSLERVQSVR